MDYRLKNLRDNKNISDEDKIEIMEEFNDGLDKVGDSLDKSNKISTLGLYVTLIGAFSLIALIIIAVIMNAN